MIVSKSDDHEKGNALKKSHKGFKKIKNLNLFSQFFGHFAQIVPLTMNPIWETALI